MSINPIETTVLSFLARARPNEFTNPPENWKSQEVGDLGLDSLDLTTLSLDIEDSLNVLVEVHEISGAPTLGNLIELIESR